MNSLVCTQSGTVAGNNVPSFPSSLFLWDGVFFGIPKVAARENTITNDHFSILCIPHFRMLHEQA